MGLRDVEATLPPGFRFYPSDEELVCHYLYKKVANERLPGGSLVEIDLHTCEPWELPDMAKLGEEWYFFSFRDWKYTTGSRSNRATKSGYWKATGRDRTVVDPTIGSVVGMRKTLVFYKERAPHGVKTSWVMHEFRLEVPHTAPKEDWVLCRVFNKNKGESSHFNPNNIEHQQATLGRWSANMSAHRERCTSAISSMASLGMQRHTLVGLPNEVVSYAADGVGMETRSAMDEFRFLMELGSEDEERGGGLLSSEFMQ